MISMELVVQIYIWSLVALVVVYVTRSAFEATKDPEKPYVYLSGSQLKEIRKTLGLSRERMGKELKVSRVTIYRWETGRTPIPERVVKWVVGIWEQQP